MKLIVYVVLFSVLQSSALAWRETIYGDGISKSKSKSIKQARADARSSASYFNRICQNQGRIGRYSEGGVSCIFLEYSSRWRCEVHGTFNCT